MRITSRIIKYGRPLCPKMWLHLIIYFIRREIKYCWLKAMTRIRIDQPTVSSRMTLSDKYISNRISTFFHLYKSTTCCLNLRGIVNWLTVLCRWLNPGTNFKVNKTMVYFKKCVDQADNKKQNLIIGRPILHWTPWLTRKKRSRIADIETTWGAASHAQDPAISTMLGMLQIIKINSLNSERVHCKSLKKIVKVPKLKTKNLNIQIRQSRRR